MPKLAQEYLRAQADKRRQQGQGDAERDRYLGLWDKNLEDFTNKMNSNRDWRDEMTIKSQLAPQANKGWLNPSIQGANMGAGAGAAMGPVGALVGGIIGGLAGQGTTMVSHGMAAERLGHKDPWLEALNPIDTFGSDEELLAAGANNPGRMPDPITGGMIGDIVGGLGGLGGTEEEGPEWAAPDQWSSEGFGGATSQGPGGFDSSALENYASGGGITKGGAGDGGYTPGAAALNLPSPEGEPDEDQWLPPSLRRGRR